MPGVSLGITLPTVGVTVGPDYATQINAALSTIISDIEAKIVPGEITTNADWDFSSAGVSYSLTNAKRLALTNQGALLPGGNSNSVYVKSGELHYQDASGNNVQITSGGSVNNAAAGSINTTGTPAYGAGPEVLWSGTDLEYRFKSGAGATDFADLVFSKLEFRFGSFTMTMGCNVTADYNINWPATAAAENSSLMEVSTSGDVTFTKAPSVTTLDATGDVTANDLKHTGTQTLYISAAEAVTNVAFGTDSIFFIGDSDSIYATTRNDPDTFYFPVPLKKNDVISRIDVAYATDNTSNSWTVALYEYSWPDSGTFAGGGTNATLIDSATFTNNGVLISNTSNNRGMAAVGGTLGSAVYFVKIIARGTANGSCKVFGIRIQYTRP